MLLLKIVRVEVKVAGGQVLDPYYYVSQWLGKNISHLECHSGWVDIKGRAALCNGHTGHVFIKHLQWKTLYTPVCL